MLVVTAQTMSLPLIVGLRELLSSLLNNLDLKRAILLSSQSLPSIGVLLDHTITAGKGELVSQVQELLVFEICGHADFWARGLAVLVAGVGILDGASVGRRVLVSDVEGGSADLGFGNGTEVAVVVDFEPVVWRWRGESEAAGERHGQGGES